MSSLKAPYGVIGNAKKDKLNVAYTALMTLYFYKVTQLSQKTPL